MDRTKHVHPHHLRDAPPAVTIRLVYLSFQEGFGMTRLDADSGKPRFNHPGKRPLGKAPPQDQFEQSDLMALEVP
jgi:hypothetical protein